MLPTKNSKTSFRILYVNSCKVFERARIRIEYYDEEQIRNEHLGRYGDCEHGLE